LCSAQPLAATCSPELAVPDIYLFEPIKEALRGQQITEEDKMKEAEHDWLRAQQGNFAKRRSI
jgi:hypothetical protein